MGRHPHCLSCLLGDGSLVFLRLLLFLLLGQVGDVQWSDCLCHPQGFKGHVPEASQIHTVKVLVCVFVVEQAYTVSLILRRGIGGDSLGIRGLDLPLDDLGEVRAVLDHVRVYHPS